MSLKRMGRILLTAILLAASAQASRPHHTHSKTASISTSQSSPAPLPVPIRGINLGGWLILEDWLNPDMFVGTGIPAKSQDQYHFDQSPNAKHRLHRHWNTYITEADFDDFQRWGINAIRIPVGYWAYTDAPPYLSGADAFVEKALSWARERGIGAIIDLHGLPGSQNGFGHSGIKMDPDDITWQTQENLDLSITVLETIARKYANGDWSDVVRGISLVNEPIVYGANSFDLTKDWVVRAYNAVAEAAANKDLYIISHDSFMDPWNWYDVLDRINSGPNGGRFILDTHAYQNKGSDMSLTQDQRIILAGQLRTPFLDARKNGLNMIVGEWSLASSFCMAGKTQFPGHTCHAPACNCTGDPNPQWCGDYDTAMLYQVRRYGEIQQQLWETYTHGWFMWTAKAQGAWGLNTSMSEDCHLMSPLRDDAEVMSHDAGWAENHEP